MGAKPCRPCLDDHAAEVEVDWPLVQHWLADRPPLGEVDAGWLVQVGTADGEAMTRPCSGAACGYQPWPPGADGGVYAAGLLATGFVLGPDLPPQPAEGCDGAATLASGQSRQASRCSSSRTNSCDSSFETLASVSSMASTMIPDKTSGSQVRIGTKRLEFCSPDDILHEVRNQLDNTNDVLRAEFLLAELKKRLSVREWDALQESELLEQFRAHLERFFDIGRLCCLESRACVLVEVGAVGLQLQPRMGEWLLRPYAVKLLRQRALALQRTAASAAAPGSAWEARREADGDGLYAQLDAAARSKGSCQHSNSMRGGAASTAAVIAAPSNLAHLFARDGVLRYRPGEQEPPFCESMEPASKESERRRAKKHVHFGPGIILHCIPDRAGHREEYEFLTEQHERLKKAMKVVMKTTPDEDLEHACWKTTRVACAAMERQYTP